MDTAGIESLLLPLLGPVAVVGISDANQGRGIFSDVVRVTLQAAGADMPEHVIVKYPGAGPNGAASVASGATTREAQAYRSLLPGGGIAYPACFASDGDGIVVLEDLTNARFVDQLDGAAEDDSRRVVAALGSFHKHWQDKALPADLAGSALDTIDPERFAIGHNEVQTTWAADLSPTARAAYSDLFDRRDDAVVELATLGPPTLTHGDPRIDNIAFVDDEPVFFDWQQIGVQAGVVDLAWFAATSITPATRRASIASLVAAYASAADRPTNAVSDDLRIAVAYPGLLSLLLATRVPETDRARRFIAISLERIGSMLHDLAGHSA